MKFKITADEKAFILKKRKSLKRRRKVKARSGALMDMNTGLEGYEGPSAKVAQALDKLSDYFEIGISRVKKLEILVNRAYRKSSEGRYLSDMISRIKDGLDIATDEMEDLRDSILESIR